MQTKQIYHQDPYLKELECTVLSTENKGALTNVILDQTIFYPEGGGQPSDIGQLGNTQVKYVRLSNEEIIHQVAGDLAVDETVVAKLDWKWRHKYMRIHTAGHLLHDVIVTIEPSLVPKNGSHGKKPFLEYQGSFDLALKDDLEKKVNEVLEKNLTVTTSDSTYQELEKECLFLPPNLPKNKPLRMIKIGDFPAMPDGGVHVKTTKEIGKVWIANLTCDNGVTKVRYGVVDK